MGEKIWCKTDQKRHFVSAVRKAIKIYITAGICYFTIWGCCPIRVSLTKWRKGKTFDFKSSYTISLVSPILFHFSLSKIEGKTKHCRNWKRVTGTRVWENNSVKWRLIMNKDNAKTLIKRQSGWGSLRWKYCYRESGVQLKPSLTFFL